MLDRWAVVDRYLVEKLHPTDAQLEEAISASDRAGLAPVHVSPLQGKLLYLLASIQGAKKILEIGTLAGYSTIWLARALPDDGQLITLEVDSKHARLAETNLRQAGLESRVDVRVGPALDTLPKLAADAPFDLIFIDADKANNAQYLDWSIHLSRSGTVIIADNVVRDGAITVPDTTDPSVQGVQRFFDSLANDPRLEATAIQTVGEKGYDGFTIIRVLHG